MFVIFARENLKVFLAISDCHKILFHFVTGVAAQYAQDSMEAVAESNLLWAILLVVDGQEKVEAILDPGCQIVVMSEEVCNALALPYDLSICLSMVLANDSVTQSLGLTRNIPFLVSEITFYLQVHILHLPAYNILLS